MRSDPSADFDPDLPVLGLGTPGRTFESGVSFSGKERNHLFLNVEGRAFDDVGAISGLDGPADGRSFAWLDFDRDGWTDVAIVNANAPLLQVFRNEIAAAGEAAAGGFVALRFVGGNTSPGPSPGASNRDGIGARVEVELGDRTLLREHRAGEGFAAQNSATLVVGIGMREQADAVRVTWPSGLVQVIEDVPAGSLLTVHETPPPELGDAVATRTAYARAEPAPWPPAPAPHDAAPALVSGILADATPGALNVFTTMATWCESCRRELPQVQLLRDRFSESDVRLFGIPVDPEDDRTKLTRWQAEQRPGYELQLDLAAPRIAEFDAWMEKTLRRGGLPATVVTDAAGRVLATRFGVPTVSMIVGLLDAQTRIRPDVVGRR